MPRSNLHQLPATQHAQPESPPAKPKKEIRRLQKPRGSPGRPAERSITNVKGMQDAKDIPDTRSHQLNQAWIRGQLRSLQTTGEKEEDTTGQTQRNTDDRKIFHGPEKIQLRIWQPTKINKDTGDEEKWPEQRRILVTDGNSEALNGNLKIQPTAAILLSATSHPWPLHHRNQQISADRTMEFCKKSSPEESSGNVSRQNSGVL